MTIFDTLSLDQLRTRTSEKWRQYGPDVLPLWVAEMDVPQAEPVIAAVTDALRRGDTGYPGGRGYAEAFAGFAADRWGWELDPSKTRMLTDVMIGITDVLKVLTRAGDTVVVNTPVYPPFYDFVRDTGRVVRAAPLTADHRLDLAALDEAFVGATVFLLCNPHNPTGTAHTPAELVGLADLARRHGVRIVADEIHAPITSPAAARELGRPVFTPIVTVPGAENAISVVSASKAWNLAGLKAALAIGGPEAVADVAAIAEIADHGASHLAAIAHAAALTHARGWLDDVLTGIDVNRAYFTGLLASRLPDAVVHPAQATYLAWVDCRAVRTAAGDLLGDDPSRAFLKRGQVAFTSGVPFGAGGEGHVRINLATSRAILDEAVARMCAALEQA
ncbi:cystathione beta-lyase [Sanguibacter gelidistatuariae]|uniref:cysteine-S-conjugate beta-lyase n=2 Tax=Sanguibacter gelidistatuariae TaxID=1814289 RepID=A0A1G6H6L6_9MICO|nr:aminotransferase class I/II-fold pyridoxal phosphate-dependent enzyme [Sanguibacter gelidistatuariae]SDB89919.1 cystathione beta-lyase [Sanguibacter gelidistatuariae]